jgi:hypothetical protein
VSATTRPTSGAEVGRVADMVRVSHATAAVNDRAATSG